MKKYLTMGIGLVAVVAVGFSIKLLLNPNNSVANTNLGAIAVGTTSPSGGTPFVGVSSPVGASVYSAGQTIPVTWTTYSVPAGDIANIYLGLYSNGTFLGNYIPLAENIANNGTASVTLPTSFVGTTVTFGKNFKIIVSISNSAGVGLVNNASQLFTINNFTLQSKSTADALPYWYVQCPDGTLMRASTSAPVSTLNWACDNFTPNLGGKI